MHAPLCFQLCRPFFDLSAPGDESPLHAFDPIFAFEKLRKSTTLEGPMMAMTPVFRQTLIEESGLLQFQAENPLNLPANLHSENWAILCEYLKNWIHLAAAQRIFLARLLYSLNFHRYANDLIASHLRDAGPGQREATELSFLLECGRIELASAIKRFPTKLSGIFFEALPDPVLAIRIASVAATVLGRYLGTPDEAETWIQRGVDLLGNLEETVDPFDFLRIKVSLMRLEAVAKTQLTVARRRQILDSAHGLLSRDNPDTRAKEILLSESKRRLLDQRSLFLWSAGEYDRAIADAETSVRLDPNCSKANMLLGDLLYNTSRFEDAANFYGKGAQVGPLFTGRCHFMAGHSNVRLGRHAVAIQNFLDAWRIEPQIGTAQAMLDAANVAGDQAGARMAAEMITSRPAGSPSERRTHGRS